MTLVTSDDMAYVRTLVHDAAGLVVEPGKDYLVRSRLAPIAVREGFADLTAMLAALRRQPYGALHHQVVQAMTTNETSWFRDSHPFVALRERIIPELIERRRGERRLTIWSAACSTGQEPYSVAMLLLDSFPELAGWRVDLLASDLAEGAVARARAGRYSDLEAKRGMPPEQLAAHFRRDGGDWVVSDRVRRMVRFGVLNLIGDLSDVPVADLVLLRNVMIYFDHATKRDVLARVRGRMRPDGFLMLGNAETTLNLDDDFVRVDAPRAGCYRLASAVVPPRPPLPPIDLQRPLDAPLER